MHIRWFARQMAALLVLLCPVALAPSARADSPLPGARPAVASFALIIGVNTSLDTGRAPLQYADDDAARYLDLFRAIGARTYLVTRVDQNTRRLHPQAAAEASVPRRAELDSLVTAMRRDIAQAHQQGVRVVLYVVYAGHGDVQDGSLALTLEDGPMPGRELVNLATAAGADDSHLIVDACHAHLLAWARGPGGNRRPLPGFVELEAAARDGNVGFLLARSRSGESHEWEGFEAGVFSHVLRSGLYGAADADLDGRVSYPEIAAFIARANEAVVSEKFRPEVLARAPRGGDLLVDLRAQGGRQLRFEGWEAGAHYLLEDDVGVRLLDFHGSGAHPVRLVRPAVTGPLYLRRLSDGQERTVPASGQTVRLDRLPPEAPRWRPRGAAHQAFNQLFSLSFDPQAVITYQHREAVAAADLAEAAAVQLAAASRLRKRRLFGSLALGASAAAATVGTLVLVNAHRLRAEAPAKESERDTERRNQGIGRRNLIGGVILAGAGVALAGALQLLLWPSPEAAPAIDVALSPAGGAVNAGFRF